MKTTQLKKARRASRHRKIRMKVSGLATRPRLSVFRSNKHIYAQVIDDESRRTLVSANDREIKKLAKDEQAKKMLPRVADAYLVGQLLATKAISQHLKSVVFDRGGYLFTGRVAALAAGARVGGLNF